MLTHTIRICIIGIATRATHCSDSSVRECQENQFLPCCALRVMVSNDRTPHFATFCRRVDRRPPMATPYCRQAPRTRPMCWIAANRGTRRMRGPTVPDRSFSVPGRSRCGRNAHGRGRSKCRMRDISTRRRKPPQRGGPPNILRMTSSASESKQRPWLSKIRCGRHKDSSDRRLRFCRCKSSGSRIPKNICP